MGRKSIFNLPFEAYQSSLIFFHLNSVERLTEDWPVTGLVRSSGTLNRDKEYVSGLGSTTHVRSNILLPSNRIARRRRMPLTDKGIIEINGVCRHGKKESGTPFR